VFFVQGIAGGEELFVLLPEFLFGDAELLERGQQGLKGLGGCRFPVRPPPLGTSSQVFDPSLECLDVPGR